MTRKQITMTEKHTKSIQLPKSLVVEANDSPEIIYQKAVKLYMEYGKLGAGLISEDAERKIERESEALLAYNVSRFQDQAELKKALIDPTKIEESRQRGLSFYNLVVASLPTAP